MRLVRDCIMRLMPWGTRPCTARLRLGRLLQGVCWWSAARMSTLWMPMATHLSSLPASTISVWWPQCCFGVEPSEISRIIAATRRCTKRPSAAPKTSPG
ncbi:unnamed protein product [Symbiodinium sp. CCMP2592]|nr:unnamed protein product [Symbiodinium sp. CCMP2592]